MLVDDETKLTFLDKKESLTCTVASNTTEITE